MLSERKEFHTPVVYWMLVFAIILAPLPFASNRLWSWSLLGVWIALIALIWSIGHLRRWDSETVFTKSLIVPGMLITGVVAFIIMQASCWSPETWHHPVWSWTDNLQASSACSSVSIDRYETLTSLGRLLTYITAFWITVQIAGDRRHAYKLITLISAIITMNAAYGVILTLMGLDVILWYQKWAYHDVATGTFVNRNAFAVFCGMGAICNFGIVLTAILRATKSDKTWSDRIRHTTNVSAHDLKLSLTGLLVCICAVVLTASRAGLTATILGMAILVIVTCSHWRVRRRWLVSGLVGIVAAVLILMETIGGNLLERVEDIDEHLGNRSQVISATFHGALERPWLGHGFGTFEEGWPQYRPRGVRSLFRYAHSTYVENIYELGFPASIALFVAVAWLMLICIRGVFARQRDGIFACIAVSAASVPVSHSLIDFSLQIPALVLILMIILGIGFRQSFSSQ